MARSTSGSASGSMKKLTVRPFMAVLRSRLANPRPGYDARPFPTRDDGSPPAPTLRLTPPEPPTSPLPGAPRPPVPMRSGQGLTVTARGTPARRSAFELLGDAGTQRGVDVTPVLLDAREHGLDHTGPHVP